MAMAIRAHEKETNRTYQFSVWVQAVIPLYPGACFSDCVHVLLLCIFTPLESIPSAEFLQHVP